MKKILAAILAAAMTLSLGITAFAADATKATFSEAIITMDVYKGAESTAGNSTLTIALKAKPKTDIVFKNTATIAIGSTTEIPAATVAAAFVGDSKPVTIDGVDYTFHLANASNSADLTISAVAVAAGKTGITSQEYTVDPSTGIVLTDAKVTFKDGTDATGYEAGSYVLEDVIHCVGGVPVAMVESVDDLNAVDGAKSGTTLYYQIITNKFPEENFDFSVSKADSAKNVAKVSVVDKKFSSNLFDAAGVRTGAPVGGTSGDRFKFVQVELKENFTDAEYKVSFDLKAKCTKEIGAFKKGEYYKFESTGKTWVANTVLDADQDFVNGTSGIVLKPQKNEDNEITWEDENDTVARLTFVGDSNVAKFYPKLSTKWDNADYAELFADQNAFYFDFVGNMGNQTQISSTSRATLEIYNPYYDKETDELTVDPTEIVIYQVATDGSFTDVSDQFTVGENDDGDSVYTTKTRELGTYIFAEKVLAAVEEEVVEAPAKDIPNTGR